MKNKAIWYPTNPKKTRMWQFMQSVSKTESQSLNTYHALHDWSIENPALFWQKLCEFFDIKFDTPPDQILNDYDHMIQAKWFQGATFNFAEKLLNGPPDQPAIIALDEQNKRTVLTYRELRNAVARCAAGLKKAGIQSGDRVAAFMPNVAETVIAFLASASIGAIWSSCSPDFGVQAAVDRLGQLEPKLLFLSNQHQYNGKLHQDLEKLNDFIDLMPSLDQVVVCPMHNQSLDISSYPKAKVWQEFLNRDANLTFTSLPFSHPLYILFSSGTTGKPKCILHSAGGALLQHIKELGLHTDISSEDRLFFYTTCGWMMWNWMVSVLALGATLVLYEGSPNFPNAYRLFELIDSEKITVFGTSAKFLSMVEKSEAFPAQYYEMSDLRCLLSTGSPLLPKNYDFVYEHIKSNLQLASISGGTDIVSCFALGNPMLPIYRGELQCLGLGMSVKIFNEHGEPIKGERGELVCTQPFPSMPLGFWQDDDKTNYKKAYFDRFPGVWAHGDFAELTEHGGLIIYGRSDAVLNPGGVRIGTAEIYRQVEKIPEILDSVVIGQDWQDDIRIVLFVKLKRGVILNEELKNTIRQTIRTNASPRHVPAKIIEVPDIPRTINNKIVELAVRNIVHGKPVNNIQSLANPEALEYFKSLDDLYN
ncbi:acetoacetate--CoA ligase [Legionella impletisoli]|uniref:Acetoacetyl-CoA synthetase n=1 Tax=Legionella impletisoli TaxID=343510 RepID=A0A917JNP9_9GAMM|nr:acetoacetate--CoA ligase [Legionella impletisoli]GGI79212.1 acetoacetyl-CoA synthetase [Legionella impletisoli]